MGDWFSSDNTRFYAMGTVEQTQSSRGTGLQPAAANVKGTYGLLSPFTPFDASGIIVHVSAPLLSNHRGLIDVALGVKGSEVPILSNLHVDSTSISGANSMASFFFPISIPRGSTVSARIQNSGGAAANRMHVCGYLIGGGFADSSPQGKVTTYGANLSDSGGTQIDPGGTAGVKGAWVEITSSTSADISTLSMAIGNNANSSRPNTSWLVDIGVGPSGSEKVAVSNLPLGLGGVYITPRVVGPLSVSIPARSRIAIRAQSTITDATDRVFDVVLYGVS